MRVGHLNADRGSDIPALTASRLESESVHGVLRRAVRVGLPAPSTR